jgi:hypothetical protein
LLVMLDTQVQFMLADFQQRLESPHPLRVHAINAMSCVAVTKVMLVTVCLKRKAATPPTYQHNSRDTQATASMGK